MQLSHTVSAMSVGFDDPNLVSSAGLVPVLGLARRCGLHDAAAESLRDGPVVQRDPGSLDAGHVSSSTRWRRRCWRIWPGTPRCCPTPTG